MAYSNTSTDLDNYGFDCTFLAEPPPKLICPICTMLLRDPYQSQCCGCHYCHCCVQQLLSKTVPCVVCSGVVKAFRDVSVTQQINSLQVKCSNADCRWTGELGVIGEHMVTCEQKPTKCSSCGLFVPKEILHDHQSIHCPKRAFTCQFCNNFTSTFEEVRSTHWPQCPSYPILCPNGCSTTKKVLRDQLLSHLNDECTVKQRVRDMAETIELLESALEQKEQRIEELEAEVGEKTSGKKGKKTKWRRLSKNPDDCGKERETYGDHSDRSRSDSGNTADSGKERNYEREINLLKECIAEKVANIEELRLHNLNQNECVLRMEEDFSSQLRAMKYMCQKLSEEKDSLEKRFSKMKLSSEDKFSQLI